MTLHTHAQQFRDKGYTDILNNGSRQGAIVLVNPAADRIIKFGEDYAYEVFMDFVKATGPDKRLPIIYHYETPNGSLWPNRSSSNGRYTLTIMEALEELNAEEAEVFDKWFADFSKAVITKTPAPLSSFPDPLGISDIYSNLWDTARPLGIGIEQKAASCMVRVSNSIRQIVLTDPLH